MSSPTVSGITSWQQLRNEATYSQEITTGSSASQKSPAEWEHVSEGPWSRRRKHQSVVWGTNLLLLGGFDGEAAFDLNDVWSYDGQSWQMVTDHAGWSGRDGHCAVVFKGSIFVMGGTDDPYNCKCDVWRSDNGGSTWLQICPYAPWPERWQHAACVHDGRIYVIGGWGDRYLNDVWASSDGINWTQECANAPWKPRMFLSVVVFNDAIYVIGGHDGRMQLRDAWASCDGGKTWTQVCQAAQWEGRQGHACVTLDGHVYLMGGFGGATRFNDLWRSTDCAHWTLMSRNCNWSPRQGHACLAFRGSIYILGGFDASGYCNNVYRLRINEEDGQSSGAPGGSPLVSLDNGIDERGNESRRSTQRQITVSITCVLESVKSLRMKRYERERLVQGLVSVVGLVMKAANITAESLEEVNHIENGPDMRSGSEDCEGTLSSSNNHKPTVINKATTTTIQQTSTATTSTLNKNAMKLPPVPNDMDITGVSLPLSPETKSSFRSIKSTTKTTAIVPSSSTSTASVTSDSVVSPLAKIGHPFRMALAATGAPVTGSHGIKNDEDLLMQFWQVLPRSSRSTSEDIKNLPDAVSFGGSNQGGGKLSLEVGASSSTGVGVSSAALRESMEQDRATLKRIQRNIRGLAEQNDEKAIEELIVKRTILAARSALLADQLRQHVHAVREMQDSRNRVLSRTLTQLEDLLIVIGGKKLGGKGDSKLSAAEEKTIGLSSSSSSSSSSTPPATDAETEDSYERCSWTEWEDVMKRCSSVIKAVDCVPTENAISALRDDLDALSEITLKTNAWMAKGAFDTNGSAPPVLLGTEGLLALLTPGSGLSGQRSLQHNKSIEEAFNQDDVPNSSSEESECAALSAEYEAILNSLDKRRMDVKSSVDNEVVVIDNLEPELKSVLLMVLTKGCGLTRNLISQNRLDTMEITSMETEMNNWLEKVKILADREELKIKCERLCSENTAKEENLLKLENERIDVRSTLEKASLLGSRRSKYDVDIEEIKETHRLAEKCVKNARREMRAWYREVRKFASETAPELFHMLPDLQTAGSVMGDGGFAESAKLPRRRLEEYENIAPLTNPVQGITGGTSNKSSGGGSATGTSLATSPATSSTLLKKMDSIDGGNSGTGVTGRHVLLKATYDGEEVVLKGFIMNEKDQRKGLERELAILGRLRNDTVICPSALVEDSGTIENSYLQQVAVFIEYPYYKGGNLSLWLKASERKPWELQGIARQLLYGLLFLHDHGVIHRDIKPSNVLMHEDGRVVLTDFELSREVKKGIDEEATTTCRSGTRGFMAPEVEAGGVAMFASDMYSFGVLLLYMHYPAIVTTLIPGSIALPPSCEAELSDLIQRLLSLIPSTRPSAATALMHPYFRSTFVERLLQEGEVVEQDRKLEAVRDLLHRVRSENRTVLDKITVNREVLVETILDYFQSMPLEKMRSMLKITFVGEPGVDEGGLLTEMFTIFYDAVFSGHGGLFESASQAGGLKGPDGTGSLDENSVRVASDIVLPSAADATPERMKKLRAFGRSMVKALYEGRRIGNRLCPSVFKFLTDTSPTMRDLQMFDPQTVRSLQWTLATIGVEEFGIHFESVGEPELGVVNDANKSKFVRSKIDQILVKSRHAHLLAIKTGFSEALRSLSEEAAPFLSLLSHTDWRVMLCGDTAISGPQVNAALKYSGFPKKSLVPIWLKEIIISFSEDHLRKFLVFVTGCPSLASTSSFGRVEINVRYQARSGALPVAHTCFFHLDIPDYKEKEVLQSKLMYAIQHATSFEIV